MMALQNALEGLGSAGRAGLSVHFQNLLNFLAPRFAAQYFFNRAFMHAKLRGQCGIAQVAGDVAAQRLPLSRRRPDFCHVQRH